MLERDDLELLQRHADGDLGAEDRARAERLLASNVEARSAFGVLKAVADGLPDGMSADAPQEMTSEIMARVKSVRHFAPGKRTWGPAVPRESVMSTRSKIVAGISAVAAVLLVGVYIVGVPRVDEGADATIGGAQRYQAPQLAAKDVAVGDTDTQAFLQSETFDRILKDPNARKLLSDANVRTMLASQELQGALAEPEFAAALRRLAASDAALMRMMSDADMSGALADMEIQA
jgi:hypothetical protein